MQRNNAFRRDAPVVGTRPEFNKRVGRAWWRGTFAVLILWLLLIQLAVYVCHWVWVAEVKLGLLLCCRLPS